MTNEKLLNTYVIMLIILILYSFFELYCLSFIVLHKHDL